MTLQNSKILIVDDDTSILQTAKAVLKKTKAEIQISKNPHDITGLLKKRQYDLVLLDMNFQLGDTSGSDGLHWLNIIKQTSQESKVVMMTAYGDIQLAVEAMKCGASDFLIKPWENEVLIQTLEKALKSENPSVENVETSTSGIHIIGQSVAMQGVFKMIEKVAPTDANVLILGENGTGKELIAQSIHEKSKRNKGAFIGTDLGAISETLFESELFGHTKGAFTDAKEDRKGRFETASGGTIFLDEIGNLSLPLQAKLLTALQSRSVTPVGSNQTIPIDIRLVSATNANLSELIAEKAFRQDLLYRINTVEIRLPALRERPDDIEPLANYYLKKYAQQYDKNGLSISPKAIEHLKKYRWPGNVRELQHALERAIIMTETDALAPSDFPLHIEPNGGTAPQKLEGSLEDVEKEAIRQVLEKHQGNVSKAARELGLGRNTLYRKIYKYGL